MTAEPYQPPTDRGASPSDDPDIIVVPEDAVEGDVVEGDVIEPEVGADYGVANNSAANNGREDDLTDSSWEQDNVSSDYQAATEPSLVAEAAEAEAPGGSDGDSISPAQTTAIPMSGNPMSGNPMSGNPTTGSPAAADSHAADLGQQWHDIQAMFVDDPRGSVERAAAAAAAAVSALTETLQQHAALTQAGADTEQLREALRSYRVFCQSLADFDRQLGQQTVSR